MAKNSTLATELKTVIATVEANRAFNYKAEVIYKLSPFEDGKFTRDGFDSKGKEIKEVKLTWGDSEKIMDIRNLLPFGLLPNGTVAKNRVLGADVESISEAIDVISDDEGFTATMLGKADGFGSSIDAEEQGCIAWGKGFYKRRVGVVQLVDLRYAVQPAAAAN